MVFRPELGPLGRRYAVAAFLLCLATVIYLSLAPGALSPAGGLPLDKLQHAVAYFGLTGLGLIAFGARPWLLLLILAVGAGMEVAQAQMDFGRQGDVIDLAANLSGEAVALGVWTLWRRRR